MLVDHQMFTQITATNKVMNILPSAQSMKKYNQSKKKNFIKIHNRTVFLGDKSLKYMLVFKTMVLTACL